MTAKTPDRLGVRNRAERLSVANTVLSGMSPRTSEATFRSTSSATRRAGEGTPGVARTAGFARNACCRMNKLISELSKFPDAARLDPRTYVSDQARGRADLRMQISVTRRWRSTLQR